MTWAERPEFGRYGYAEPKKERFAELKHGGLPGNWSQRHWGYIEGPVYADRVGGRVTFLDWDNWEPEHQAGWAEEKAKRESTLFIP